MTTFFIYTGIILFIALISYLLGFFLIVDDHIKGKEHLMTLVFGFIIILGAFIMVTFILGLGYLLVWLILILLG